MSVDFYRYFCFAGMAVIAGGILYSSLRYRGRTCEKYSLLNHFVSELGETGVTPGARAFNLSLIVGSLLNLPYVVGMGIRFDSWLGWLGMAAGLIAAQGAIGVGIFPMTRLEAHVRAAQIYFQAGLMMIFLFGLAIVFQPAGRHFVPQTANILTVLTFASFASFLFILPVIRAPSRHKPDDPAEKPPRPRVWVFPILEWLGFLFMLFWLFGMAFFI